MVNLALFVVQLAVTVVVGIYFFRQLRQQKRAQPAARRESNRELENLRKMRSVHLSEPLAEKVRPSSFKDIIGQEEGIKEQQQRKAQRAADRAALPGARRPRPADGRHEQHGGGRGGDCQDDLPADGGQVVPGHVDAFGGQAEVGGGQRVVAEEQFEVVRHRQERDQPAAKQHGQPCPPQQEP